MFIQLFIEVLAAILIMTAVGQVIYTAATKGKK
jgi:hypothetical protein